MCTHVFAYIILHFSKGRMVLKWLSSIVTVSDISVVFCLALKVVGSKLLRAECVGINSRVMIEVGLGLVGESELEMMGNGHGQGV